jgi:hypothetical protein
MSERRIDPGRDNPYKFTIPSNSDLLNDFPDQDQITIILSPETTDQLDIFYKPLPVAVKNLKYGGKKVHWINNFGIKQKAAASFEKKVEQYEIHLKHIADAVYVYYDGTKIKPLSTSDPVGGQVSAKLDLGDPPVGWVK